MSGIFGGGSGGGGGGTVTGAANEGNAGYGFFDTLSGSTLEFYNLAVASNKLSLTQDTVNKNLNLDVNQVNLTLSSLGGAISTGQLPGLASTKIWVGNGSGVATAVNASGDLSLANTGAFSIGSIQGTTVSGTTGTTNVVFSSGPTLLNPIVGTQSASDNTTKAASTAYVTTAITNAIAGVNPAVAVQAATTSASNTSGLTYNNGVSGVGATLTGSNNTAITWDGYTFTAVGQRGLVKNDTQSPSGAFNGIYYVTQIQTAILPPILTRALDYDQPSDINNTGAIPVINGTVNGGTSWVETATVNTMGTDPLAFTQFSLNPITILTNTLPSADIFVGNASNIATGVAMSGDVGISNTGATTIGAAAVTYSKIQDFPIDLLYAGACAWR
jgi:hypothetical protein